MEKIDWKKPIEARRNGKVYPARVFGMINTNDYAIAIKKWDDTPECLYSIGVEYVDTATSCGFTGEYTIRNVPEPVKTEGKVMKAVDFTKAVCVPIDGGKYLPVTVLGHLDDGCFAVTWRDMQGAWVITMCDDNGQCRNGYVVQNVPEPAAPIPHTRETWPWYQWIQFPTDKNVIMVIKVNDGGIFPNGIYYKWEELARLGAIGSHDGKSWEPLAQKEVAK